MSNNKPADFMEAAGFTEVSPMDFYRELFPAGKLEGAGEQFASDGTQKTGKYCGIALEMRTHRKGNHSPMKYLVFDDLETIRQLQESENFVMLSPLSYYGRKRDGASAVDMYALTVEIDNLREKNGNLVGLGNLLGQFDCDEMPRPTFVVASGTGVHLYYVFVDPVRLHAGLRDDLDEFKAHLTRSLWNRYVTESYRKEDIQFESLYQAFRMVGGVTKKGDKVRAFRVGQRVTLEDLNTWGQSVTPAAPKLSDEHRSRSGLNLDEARREWPEWYERRVVQGQPKRRSTIHRGLYDSWKKTITGKPVVVGHRYSRLLVLAAYAKKCGIEYNEFRKDCYEIGRMFQANTPKYADKLNDSDIEDVVKAYKKQDDLYLMKRITAERLSGIEIKTTHRNPPGKRLSRAENLEIARQKKAILNAARKRKGEKVGKTREADVLTYQKTAQNPTPAGCAAALGISPNTVRRWWNEDITPAKRINKAQLAVYEYQRNTERPTKAGCAAATGLSLPTVRRWWASDGLSSMPGNKSEKMVAAYRNENRFGTQTACAAATGLSLSTVRKWWAAAAPLSSVNDPTPAAAKVRIYRAQNKTETQTACAAATGLSLPTVRRWWEYADPYTQRNPRRP